MDKILHFIPSGSPFIIDQDEDLYISAPGQANVIISERVRQSPNRRQGFLAPTDPTWSVVTSVSNYEGIVDLPIYEPLLCQTAGAAMCFTLQDDPDYEHKFFAMEPPVYPVAGQACIPGNQPWKSNPFSLGNTARGRLVVQLNEVWRCKKPHGYGTFYLETSDDKKEWELCQNYGLSDGMMVTTQNGAKSGDLYQDEFYIANAGQWGRVVYDCRAIIGKGYQATVNIEIAQQSTLRSGS